MMLNQERSCSDHDGTKVDRRSVLMGDEAEPLGRQSVFKWGLWCRGRRVLTLIKKHDLRMIKLSPNETVGECFYGALW